MNPTLYINIFRNGERLEAHDGVYTSRTEAIDAAEGYGDSYEFTLTEAGRINLEPEFSEEYHQRRVRDEDVDYRLEDLKEKRLEREGAHAA
jgi:hypothetical protein